MDAVALQIIEQHVRNGVRDRGIADEHNGVGVRRCLHVQLFEQRDEVVVALAVVQGTKVCGVAKQTQLLRRADILPLEPRSSAGQRKIAHSRAVFTINIDTERCTGRHHVRKAEFQRSGPALRNGKARRSNDIFAVGSKRAQDALSLKSHANARDLQIFRAVIVGQCHSEILAAELRIHLDAECARTTAVELIDRIDRFARLTCFRRIQDCLMPGGDPMLSPVRRCVCGRRECQRQ